jgi:eukaryotic-like serine/threonine-protein kinase
VPISAPEFAALNSLLDEALALDAEARKGWFYRLAEGRLKDMLREMLAQQSDLPDSDQPLSTLPKLGEDDANAHAGQRVGAYCLVREIGRGGMGSVWLAERADGNFERQIAVKLPRLAWMEGLGARMARERRIGALLEHPNIARMYDAGIDEHCRPFIAMEYIAGLAIDVYCKEHHLNVSARLRLFLQVVRAVAYAHGRLVIHRDLKPANVLVDAQERAHLLDFGIAKLAGDVAQGGGLTQEQGRVLTPNYAAPEQIAGKPIGVAADVYSLGVMLYELLTGVLPYKTKRFAAGAAEADLSEDAPPASSQAVDRATARVLRGEIDAIIAKTLKQDTKDRYATADALADDIERHLAGETVRARPDSPWYRIRKAVRRHRFGLFAGTVMLAALIAGGTAWLQAHRASLQSERAQIATAFISDLLRSRPGSTADGADASGDAYQTFLDHGSRLIETRFPEQPEMQAMLYGVVGRGYLDMEVGQLAIRYARRQIAVLDTVPADTAVKVSALLLLADAYMREGQNAEAEAQARKAVELARFDSPLWLEAMALLATSQLNNGAAQAASATALLAENFSRSHQFDPSIGEVRLLELKMRLLGLQDKLEEVTPIFERALAIALQIEGPNSRTAADLRWRYAIHLSNNIRRRTEEAKALAGISLAAMRSNGVAGRIRAAVKAAEFWSRLHAHTLVPFAEAIKVVSESREFVAAQHTVIPPIVQARLDLYLGQLYLGWTDVQQAQRWMSRSVPLIKAVSKYPWEVANTMYFEGMLAMIMGKHVEAGVLFRQNVEALQRIGGRHYIRAGWSSGIINLRMKGDFDAAEAMCDQGPPLGSQVQSTFDASSEGCGKVFRARIELDRGNPLAAANLLRESVLLSPNEQRSVETEILYGEVACATGRPGEGLPLLVDSIMQDIGSYENDPATARVRAVAGLCALALGDRKAAHNFAQLSRSAFATQPEVSPYFKAPLSKLERALAPPAKGFSRGDGLTQRPHDSRKAYDTIKE